jgi:hypothetical protein
MAAITLSLSRRKDVVKERGSPSHSFKMRISQTAGVRYRQRLRRHASRDL